MLQLKEDNKIVLQELAKRIRKKIVLKEHSSWNKNHNIIIIPYNVLQKFQVTCGFSKYKFAWGVFIHLYLYFVTLQIVISDDNEQYYVSVWYYY